MRVDVKGRVLTVVLSCRNLRALLHKAEQMGDSACTLVRVDAGWQIVVTSELDDQHYKDRPAGSMHPATEAALRSGTLP